MTMILPSGITTLVKYNRPDHPGCAVCSVHVAPSSVDRHTSFKLLPLEPPMRMMLPSGITTLEAPYRPDHPGMYCLLCPCCTLICRPPHVISCIHTTHQDYTTVWHHVACEKGSCSIGNTPGLISPCHAIVSRFPHIAKIL